MIRIFILCILMLSISSCKDTDSNKIEAKSGDTCGQLQISFCQDILHKNVDSILFLFVLKPNNCGSCNDKCINLVNHDFRNKNYILVSDKYNKTIDSFTLNLEKHRYFKPMNELLARYGFNEVENNLYIIKNKQIEKIFPITTTNFSNQKKQILSYIKTNKY